MAGLLNSWSIVMCPHGRTVQSTTSNTRVKATGDFSFPYGGHIPDQRFPVRAWSGASFVRASAMGSTRRPKQGSGPFHVDGSRVAAAQAPQGTVMFSFTQPRVSGQ